MVVKVIRFVGREIPHFLQRFSSPKRGNGLRMSTGLSFHSFTYKSRDGSCSDLWLRLVEKGTRNKTRLVITVPFTSIFDVSRDRGGKTEIWNNEFYGRSESPFKRGLTGSKSWRTERPVEDRSRLTLSTSGMAPSSPYSHICINRLDRNSLDSRRDLEKIVLHPSVAHGNPKSWWGYGTGGRRVRVGDPGSDRVGEWVGSPWIDPIRISPSTLIYTVNPRLFSRP